MLTQVTTHIECYYIFLFFHDSFFTYTAQDTIKLLIFSAMSNWSDQVGDLWQQTSLLTYCFWYHQGAKKIIFTACHLGKLKLAFTSPDVISTSPQNFLTSRIDFTVLLLIEFLKKHHLPVRQVKNRIH